ncbi:MAG: glycoside hydrolase family 31 protein [Catonella sp.]|nr:glycoside hydrolase family 31 protein [Catonella sp.]MDY6356013.1 glycoside hydrolase family 31 protein [Catonella sp.]
MIKKYTFGNPIPTESVVADIPASEDSFEITTGWSIDSDKNRVFTHMEDSDRVFGLGETVRGINKRGWQYISNNTDDPNHAEEKRSLYASHNFFILFGKGKISAFYYDTPGRITFDIGYSRIDEFSIILDDFDVDIYYITGNSLKDVTKEFRKLIGKSYIPPKWAFGFGQSRWGYKSADDIRKVEENYRKTGIPIDSIYLDIDYMDSYKDFTVNEKTFPDFKGFVNEMKNKGIHLVPIIDAGVKIEKGYPVYEEGVKNNYFVKKENGENLVAAVWPGRVHFPDFLKPEVREWFGNWYKVLLDAGIEGFWNDMNEPAIFYTEDYLNYAFEKIEDYKGKNLDINSFFEFKGLVGGIDNNPEDYRRFYHEVNGKKIRHDKVHNLYGYNMTRAAGEAFKRLAPDKNILMFSRSSYIGMHRYGGVWTGDNKSEWDHILMNIHEMPGLNMCGFLYSGADTGGFGADTTEDLLMRWTEFSIFTPLFRNHSAAGTRLQEYYRFERVNDFKNIISLRYALIPYLYLEFIKAVENDEMFIAPLAYEYENDERALDVEDELLIGSSIMIAPIYTQNATGRYVYLPEDMKLVRFRAYDDYDEEVLTKGDHYVNAKLNEVLVFIRKGHSLPLAKPAMRVEDIDESDMKEIK